MLIYLHGFRSSPASFKARVLAERMRERGRAADFACPQLPPSPREAIALVVEQFAPGPADVLIGSSLGGYYATWLAEERGCRAVLLNPAIRPAPGLARYVDQPMTMFHDDGTPFEWRHAYVEELERLVVPAITFPERYFLVAATGDELLDWREMVAHYPGARQRVIEGSDHGLSDFEKYVDEVLEFAGVPTRPAGPGPVA